MLVVGVDTDGYGQADQPSNQQTWISVYRPSDDGQWTIISHRVCYPSLGWQQQQLLIREIITPNLASFSLALALVRTHHDWARASPRSFSHAANVIT